MNKTSKDPNQSSVIQSLGTVTNLYLKASFAGANTLTGWSLDDRNPQVIEKLMPFFSWVYKYYSGCKPMGGNISQKQEKYY